MTETAPQSIPDNQNVPSKLSKIDKAAILIAKDKPHLNNSQLGKEIVKLGISKNHKSLTDRWYKNDYLRRELTEVRNKNLSTVQREHVPKALKKLGKQLNNSDDKIQLQAINTTLKYGMGEIINAPAQGVPMVAIQNAQFIIEGDITSGGQDPTKSKE